MPIIELSNEAFAVVCGLVQPADEVTAAGIFTETWPELRKTFPLAAFRARFEDTDDYHPEAGF